MLNNKEIKDIKKFIDIADRMRNSIFIKELGSLKYEFKFNADKNLIKEEIKGIKEENFHSFLLDFRKIYMQNDGCNFNYICNILYRNSNDKKIKKNIEKCRDKYSNILHQPLGFKIFIDDKFQKPQQIIDDWFNGIYFHVDNDKYDKINSIKYIKLLHQHSMMSYVIDLAYIISILSNNARLFIDDLNNKNE